MRLQATRTNTHRFVLRVKSVNIIMRLRPGTITARPTIAVVIAVLVLVTPDLTLQFGDGILKAIQFATEQIKFAPSESNKAGARRRSRILTVVAHLDDGCWRLAFDILTLVRRMVGA